MRRPSLRRWLADVLPWFSQVSWDHQRDMTRRTLALGNRVAEDKPDKDSRIRRAYKAYGDGIRR